ncbi:MAG: rhodanese-like domain-containing protein [Flavobacteriaceae bacterium]|nr:rhodanese-like domain-containing protein [Flavobacteriaceae bacterium]
MKKLVVLFLVIGLSSCKSQEKKEIAFVNIDVVTFQKSMQKKDIQLVDVRTSKEYKAGHLKSAVLINFFDTDFKAISIKKLDKKKPVYVYCRSGNRSAKAAKIYKEAGFTKVYNLIDGFNAWSAKGLEIEK